MFTPSRILPALAVLRRKLLSDSSGNATIIAALLAIPVIASLGIAVDYARISRVYSKMQIVADGAALAAASARNLSGTTDEITKKRVAIASSYLTKGLASLSDAKIVGPPTVKINGSRVTVEAKGAVQGSFVGVFKSMSASARTDNGSGGSQAGSYGVLNVAVKSEASWTTGSSLLCILVLNPSASSALEIQGTADIVAPSCAVWVNSNSNSALYENGNATLTAQKVCVNGSYTGTAYYPDKPWVGSGPCPVYADPLAYLFQSGKDYDTTYAAAKSVGSQTCTVGTTSYKCQYNGYSVTNKKFTQLTLTGSSTNVTLDPGIYDGGIQVKAGATAQLRAGTYFIQNGKFEVQQGNVVNADNGGVTIVLTEPTAGTKVTNGTQTRLDVQAQGVVNLKAPAAGNYFAGVVVTQHPNSIPTATKTTANSIIGGGTKKLTGIVYYPTQYLYITGGGTGTVASPEKISTDSDQFAIVADRVLVEGNGQLRLGGAANSTSSGLPTLPSQGQGKSVVSLK